jgi:PAS domain S-box-containing protein
MPKNLLRSVAGETNDRHSLLTRQIRHHLEGATAIPAPWMNLLHAVDEAYRQSDEDRAMLERALEISSQELLQANSQTRAMLEATPSLFLRVAFDGTVLEAKPSPLVELFCLNAQGAERRRLVLRPDFLERFKSSLVPLMQGKPMATFEIEPDGARGRLFEVRVVTVAVNQTVVVILDIADQRAAEASVRESETQFRVLAEAMPQLVWITLPDGGSIYFNQKWVDYTGMTSGESQGHGWRRALHPDDVERATNRWHQATETGEPYGIEYRLRQVDGTYHWMLCRALPLRDDAGAIVKWLGTCTDVDELRQALEAVSSSEERLRVIARVSSDVIWDWNVVTEKMQWNEGLTVLCGYMPHEIESVEAWSSHIHGDDRARVLESVHGVLEHEGNSWSDEYRFQCKDGTFVYVLDRAHVIQDAAGKPVRMIGCMTDLTQRRAAEEKLAQQAALIDEAQDAIFVRDLDHRITFWSKGAERVYGWGAGDANGSRCYELLKVDRDAFEIAAGVVLREGEWSGEMVRTAASGAILIVNSHWTLMRDGEGRPKAILSIETDMTERKTLEQHFLRAQRMESIGTLSGGIAHDLNNLLMPIMMGVDVLKRLDPDERSLRVIKNIERSAKRGANLVKQMLSFARGVDGSRVAVDVGEVVAEVQSIVENTFPKNVRFESDLPESLGSILGDPTQVHQVLLNLCVNARDAMPRGGRLTVSARNTDLDAQYATMHGGAAAGTYVVLRVADDGAGMTKEVLDRIFEPFFTTKEPGKGTGLGMSTALGIVRSHRGFVEIRSDPGKGTSVEVYLPAKSADVTPQVESQSETLPGGDGETIMVVDDETSILDITRQTLESFGYKVITAVDGAEAIALFARHHAEIAVVLTDMMMPVMDGAALVAAVRRIEPRARIVIASGQSADANAAKVANYDVRHFLAKPYTAEVMLCTLRDILEKGASQAPTAHSVLPFPVQSVIALTVGAQGESCGIRGA